VLPRRACGWDLQWPPFCRDANQRVAVLTCKSFLQVLFDDRRITPASVLTSPALTVCAVGGSAHQLSVPTDSPRQPKSATTAHGCGFLRVSAWTWLLAVAGPKARKVLSTRPYSLSPWSRESQEPSDEVIHTIRIKHLRLVQECELDGRRGWQSGVKLWRCLGLNARQVVTPRSKTAASHPW
jgi:hypothetical protein